MYIELLLKSLAFNEVVGFVYLHVSSCTEFQRHYSSVCIQSVLIRYYGSFR